MNDTYVECLVAKKPNPAEPLIKAAAYGVTAAAVLMGFLTMKFIFLIVALVLGAGCFFWLPNLSVEYEYLYVARELQVDKILAKSKRKTVFSCGVDKLEVFAQEGAYQLDSFKNVEAVTHDFTSGDADSKKYVMVFRNSNATEKLILEPDENLINAIKSVCPSKTFV